MAKPNKFIQKLMHAKTFAIRKSVVFALVWRFAAGLRRRAAVPVVQP